MTTDKRTPYKLWPIVIAISPIFMPFLYYFLAFTGLAYVLYFLLRPIIVISGFVTLFLLGYYILKGGQWFQDLRFPVINQIVSVGIYLVNFVHVVLPNTHVNKVGIYLGLVSFFLSGLYMLFSTALLNVLIKQEKRISGRLLLGLLVSGLMINLLLSIAPFVQGNAVGEEYATMIQNILRLVVRKSPTGESSHYFFFMIK